MSLNLVVMLVALVVLAYVLRLRDERRRIGLLAYYLRPYNIEQLMESLTSGYLRALEQTDPERRDQIWSTLVGNEQQLRDQVQALALAFASAPTEHTRVGRWPISIFYSRWLAPQAVFDLRKALAVHAHGITAVVDNAEGLSPRDKAFTLLAEMMLFQHTCHWYCKSLSVASARLLLRHQTPYAKVLASVSSQTRQAYAALTGR
ncbi:MAG: hypothetical protein U1E84_14085 [Rhodoferax sp.]